MLTIWARLVHPRLGGEALGGGSTNITTTTSTSTSSETQTMSETVRVDAVDQFQIRRYDLEKATRLCVPVTTAGNPTTKKGIQVPIIATALRPPVGHLVCYQAKLASKTIAQNGCRPLDPTSKGTKIVPKQAKHPKRLGVQAIGPLGGATLDTAMEVELCIPSTATLP